MTIWVIRIFFLGLCGAAGWAVGQLRPEYAGQAWWGVVAGFGFGGLMIAVDEMLKGFSLRTFSAVTFGLILGMVVAQLIDHSGLFDTTDPGTRWLVRLGLFLAFGYIGMVLAMRSNKEDFSLIIPYVRFVPRGSSDSWIVLDTSAIIDGRIVELLESNFLQGTVVVPRFVLRELHQLADSADPGKRARGQRGLEMLNRIQKAKRNEVRVHEADYPDEAGVDGKLIRLARNLGARLFTNDANLARVAGLQGVTCVNLHELARCLRTVLLPGEVIRLRIVREGRERDQGVGYLPDGTMVVVNGGRPFIGREVEVRVESSLQTGAGVMIFAELAGSADRPGPGTSASS
jgi:uncharacterized protein YacL